MRIAVVLIAPVALAACHGSLAGPPLAPQPENSFVAVSGPPPPARVEIVPPKPSSPVAWVDGAWAWEGTRWRWIDGGWIAVPDGVRYATWTTKRRPDGTLLYANPQWFDARGAPIEAPRPVAPSPPVTGAKEKES